MSKKHQALLDQYFTGIAEAPIAPSPQGGPPAESAFIPLVDRIRVLIKAIPRHMQVEGMSLEYFRTRLRGRVRRYARADEVGRALRMLGWDRRRDWRQNRVHEARWYPRDVIAKREEKK